MDNMCATWWQGSYDISPPPTKVSAQLAHRKLRKSLLPYRNATWHPILVPHIGGKVAMVVCPPPPTPVSNPILPQKAEELNFHE